MGATFYTFPKSSDTLYLLQALLDFNDCPTFPFLKLLQPYDFCFVCICILEASVTVFEFYGPVNTVKVLWKDSVTTRQS